MPELREVGEEFWVVSLVGQSKELCGIWPCKDQAAVNETMRSVALDYIKEQEVVQPDSHEGQRLINLLRDARTEKEITSARIQFEEESDYEFDVYTQRLWSVHTAIDQMKEAADAQGRTETKPRDPA